MVRVSFQTTRLLNDRMYGVRRQGKLAGRGIDCYKRVVSKLTIRSDIRRMHSSSECKWLLSEWMPRVTKKVIVNESREMVSQALASMENGDAQEGGK